MVFFFLKISENDFLEKLKHFGITLEKSLLEFLFKRLNLQLTSRNKSIPYQQMIELFQQIVSQSNKQIQSFVCFSQIFSLFMFFLKDQRNKIDKNN